MKDGLNSVLDELIATRFKALLEFILESLGVDLDLLLEFAELLIDCVEFLGVLFCLFAELLLEIIVFGSGWWTSDGGSSGGGCIVWMGFGTSWNCTWGTFGPRIWWLWHC